MTCRLPVPFVQAAPEVRCFYGNTAAAPHSILLSCLLFMLNKVWLPVISLGVGQTKKEVGHRVGRAREKKGAAQPRPDFPWYDANRIEYTTTEHFPPIREAPDVAAFGRRLLDQKSGIQGILDCL